MKLKAAPFLLMLVFVGPLVAESLPVSQDSSTQTKRLKRKKKKKISAKNTVPPASNAAAASVAAEPAAPAAKNAVTLSQVQKQQPKTDTFQSWLEGLKKRLQPSDTRANRLVAVAAVRGDDVSDAPPLYWKGKKPDPIAQVPEMKDFEAAVDVALSGDRMAAKEKLQSFLLAYPTSSLAPDAKETLARLEASAPVSVPE